MSRLIMCHVVAGYPSVEACTQLMHGMHQVGITAIEVQIPFSDPIADGETIMEANDMALNHGMTTAKSLDLIKKVRDQGVDTNIYVMSYLQKVSHFGLKDFCEEAAACQVQGLIIPDLPYDSPEAYDLQKLAAKQGLQIIPVLSPGMDPSRLQDILAKRPPIIYITSTRGITGNQYAPAEQLKHLVSNIRQESDAKIMIGFGIATPNDVRDVVSIGDIAVVGSAVIQKIKTDGVEAALEFINSLVTKR